MNNLKKTLFGFVSVFMFMLLVACSPKEVDTIKVGMVTDSGSIDDKSFNQGSWQGVLDFQAEHENVEVQYVDGIDALESAVIKLLKESFAGTFSGDEMSDEEIQEVVSTALTNYQSEHGDEFVTTSIVLECIKIDNKWYIDDLDDDFLNVIFCNFVSFMDSINYN